jgi:D-alanyl-D-alanine carboxypeptidase (penicillin-binding protein 5/6)|tara:strand:- start:1220 stop:2386 length:1167 start_codon:yes stop_codon:yes gene_type:complete
MSKFSLYFVFVVLTTFASTNTSFAFDTQAKAAYVIDQETGTVLLAKKENVALPPASMSKLMTLFIAFEALQDGRLSWDKKLPVSEHAMSYGGSTMFLDTTDRVTVKDLIRGIIVLSGNDACAVLAEALSVDGTEKGFASMMTAKAKKLGMHNSVFANSNGWPHPSQRMSMKDLAIIADHIITDFPKQYLLFSEKEFAFDGRTPSNTQNRNPLLKLDIGADGLKTGHTSEAGYGLVGSAKHGNRRVIFALTGLESASARAIEAERIVNWSFRHFMSKALRQSNSIIAHADVWMGKNRTVGMTLEAGATILLPTTGLEKISSKIVYQGPLQAPVVAGQNIGELIILIPGMPQKILPLVAADSVARGGFISRLRTAALVLLKKVRRDPQDV